MIDPGLRGKVALVTGGNNPFGIGAAVAQALGDQGCGVFIQFLRTHSADSRAASAEPGEDRYLAAQTETPDALVERIRLAGADAATMEMDLSDPNAALEIFDQIEGSMGPVEILVNNAALDAPDTFLPSAREGDRTHGGLGLPVSALTASSHDEHFAVNSRAPALLTAEFARRHIERRAGWGRVVNISTDGASGFASEVSYGASKHALESYSRAAARELGAYGITVNVVALGPVQTGWISAGLEAEIVRHIPLGRIGSPADVTGAVLFFASEQAAWITGQTLYVGGGKTMPL